MILTVTLNAAIDKTHLIPDFTLGRVNRPVETMALAGGKGINVARALKALDEPVFATGLVAGRAGTFIEGSLAKEGISHAFEHGISGESRTCLAVIHPETGETTEINEAGAPVDAATHARLLGRIEAWLPNVSWLVLSGSMPPGLTGESYLAMMELARAAGKPVSLDTSGPALAEALAGRPDVVKPNQHEAEALLGYAVTPETLNRAVAELLDHGPRILALSLGADGAVVATAEEAWYYAAPPVRVVNPIGSGDSFLAGLIAALQRGRSLVDAGRLAVACGSANAAVAGAAACERPLIETLLPMVTPAPLSEASWAIGTTA
ncbi:Tagatose-6-phosphate kinase [compost metagenome]